MVTNVPGPPLPLFLLGAPLRESYPMVPLYRNQGLGIALFSYAGGLYWGVSADWDSVPELHEFIEALEQSFAELFQAAQEEASPRTAKRPRAARGRPAPARSVRA